jgi:putative addiction module component (TIGR02574 family)
MTTYAEILNAAMTLPPHERTELAEVLWESADEPTETNGETPEISAAWREEIVRRSAAYKRGELQGIPWNQVREEVRRKYQGDA